MGPRSEIDISSSDIEEDEVLNCIRELKSNKAAGYDNISPKLVKWLDEKLAPVLKMIFNKFFEVRQYPDIFKIAKVTALFKGGDKHDCDNYRPISVLPQINQVFEENH